MEEIIRCSRFACMSPWELFERWDDITEKEFLDLVNFPEVYGNISTIKLQPYERIIPLSGKINEDIYILKPFVGKIFSYKMASDNKGNDVQIIYYNTGIEYTIVSNKNNDINVCNNILFFLNNDIINIEKCNVKFLNKYELTISEQRFRNIEIENIKLKNQIDYILQERPYTSKELDEITKDISKMKSKIDKLEEENKILKYIYGLPKIIASLLMSGKTKEQIAYELSEGEKMNKETFIETRDAGAEKLQRVNGVSRAILGAIFHETGLSRDGKIMDSKGFKQVADNYIKKYVRENNISLND